MFNSLNCLGKRNGNKSPLLGGSLERGASMKKFNSPDTAKKRSILKKDTLYKEETEKLISDNYHKNVAETSVSLTGSAFVPITTSSYYSSGTSFTPATKPLKAVPKSGSKTHAQPIKFVGLDDETESLASGRGSPLLSISHAHDASFASIGAQRHPPLSPSLSRTLQFPDTPPLPDGALDRRHTFHDCDLFGQSEVAPVNSSTTSGSPAHSGGHRIHRVPSYCANTSTYGPSRSSTPTTTAAPTSTVTTTTAPPSKSELANSVVGLPLLLATVPIVSPISSSQSVSSSNYQTSRDDTTALQPDAARESHHRPLLAQSSLQSTTDDDSVFGHENQQSFMSRQSSKESATLS